VFQKVKSPQCQLSFEPSFFIPSSPCFYYVLTMARRNNIYLDHASGTHLLPEVKTRMADWFQADYANPSSIHLSGRESASRLDEARFTIAGLLGAKPGEILFTSGATEANNLAILGAVEALKDHGNHLITCVTEHPSVLESFRYLESNGFRVTYLDVDAHGDVDPEAFSSAISEQTILASLMWTNNETGLIHPIMELAEIAQTHGVRFHCDGVQAFGHEPFHLGDAPVDSLALSGHKLGAPAGIGMLYLKKGHAVSRQSFGGNQEQSVRAGTQNHAGAVALATAMSHHDSNLAANKRHYTDLMNRLILQISDLPGIQINRAGKVYTPNILSCSFKQIDGEALFIRLDMKQIAVSNGAACSSGSQAPSHVLTAMGFNQQLAQATIRVSLGVETTQQNIDDFSVNLREIILSLYRDTVQ